VFDMSWGEMAFLAALALIVVGPKDLPRLAQGAGRVLGKAQRLYREQVFNLRRLENEIEQARAVDADGQPAYRALLPEHVQKAMAEAVATPPGAATAEQKP
jgi:sec-independent protein translocase protein TatB